MQLRQYQKEAIEATLSHLQEKTTHPIISAAGSAGKSIMIAKIAEALNEPCVILADRKELLEQNHKKFHSDCEVGIVSAGLDKWEYDKQIVVAGIQTIYNKAHLLGERKCIIVDECDLISNTPQDDTMYWQFIRSFPNVRLIGLSGTPFRTNEGKLKWGETCYNITYKDLLKQNYASPIINKISFKPNLSEVEIVGEDYTVKSLKEKYLDKNSLGDWINLLGEYGRERKHWLIFLPSVEHANNMAFGLAAIKVHARAITGETPAKDRERWIEEFKNGELQALVGVGVFERGFDAPNVDLIADFSPTKSLKKWLQRVWRGVRLAPSKENCLYLDFAGNLKEHGSINNQEWLLENGEIKIKKKYVERICPSCETFTPVFKKNCVHCNYEFIVEKQEKKAYNDADFQSDINAVEVNKKIKWYSVTDVQYYPDYVTPNGYKALRIVYKFGQLFSVSELVWENKKTGFLLKRGWRGGAIDWNSLVKPKKAQLDTSGKYPKILKLEF